MQEIKAGQIWKDNDKRGSERYLRIIRVEGDKAVCQRVFNTPDRGWLNIAKFRETRIAVRRFRPTSTGYVLVQPC